MTQEKEQTSEAQLRLQLSIANKKQKQIAILAEVFMNHIYETGSSIIFEEDDLQVFQSAFHRSMKGIQEFTV